MSKEEFLKIICGNDVECRKEALDELTPLFSTPPAQVERDPPPTPPLVVYSGDFLETFRKARALSKKYGEWFAGWQGDFCPICGLKPILFYRREVDSAIFSGWERYAKCSCGFSWRYREWRCPNCGAEGRENFSVYVGQSAMFHKCVHCGFVTVELQTQVGEEVEFLARLAVSYVE
ncbi:MAG: formate dehydrogenase [Pyrobaculum sp.]